MENALNRAVTITFGNTATQRNEFNNAGWSRQVGIPEGRCRFDSAAFQQTLIRHAKDDATVLAAYTYTFDNVGNRASMHEQNGDRVTWSYDSIYQLTREQRSGTNAYDITYTYDAVGNRLTKLQSAITATYSYDSANRLDTETTPTQIITYTFDDNGNNTVKDAAGSLTTMTWNKDNQMTVLALPSGSLLTMTYDGQGFRRSLQDASGTQKFLYDLRTGTPGLDPVLLETNASDVTQVVYTPGLSLRRSSATKYFHADALGSVRLLLDSSQVISDTYILDAWGNPIASSGSTVNPFRFVGLENYYTDTASGLLLLGVRYYDPKIGRFVSVDPKRIGRNWYRYSQCNPQNRIDASGMLSSQSHCQAVMNQLLNSYPTMDCQSLNDALYTYGHDCFGWNFPAATIKPWPHSPMPTPMVGWTGFAPYDQWFNKCHTSGGIGAGGTGPVGTINVIGGTPQQQSQLEQAIDYLGHIASQSGEHVFFDVATSAVASTYVIGPLPSSAMSWWNPFTGTIYLDPENFNYNEMLFVNVVHENYHANIGWLGIGGHIIFHQHVDEIEEMWRELYQQLMQNPPH